MAALQPASKKEVRRMAVCCCLCAGIELLVLFLLGLGGIGQFSYRTVLGAAGGTAVAVGNFALMCLMVQDAVAVTDEKLRKTKVRGSYNLRILLQAGWVAAAFFLPYINVIAAAVPLLFPTVVIWFLQITGKLYGAENTVSASRSAVPANEEETEDVSGPFEV